MSDDSVKETAGNGSGASPCYAEVPPAGTVVFTRVDTDGWMTRVAEGTDSTAHMVIRLHQGGLALVGIHGDHRITPCDNIWVERIDESAQLYRTQIDAIRAGVKSDRAYNESMMRHVTDVEKEYGLDSA